MKIWTLIDIKVNTSGVPLSNLTAKLQGSSHHGYYSGRGGSYRFEAGSYGHEKLAEFIPFLVKLPKAKAVVVLDTEDKALLIRTLKNCIVETVKGQKQEQLHFLPLCWYMAAVPFYHGHTELEKYPENGVEVYVNGEPYSFSSVCKGCSHYLNKSVGICKPLHSSCQAATYPLNPHDMLSEKKAEKLLQWFQDNPMDLKAMKALPGYEYKIFGQLSTHDSFEAATFDTITTDEDEHKKVFDERSKRSTLAAETQRLQRFSHKDCINCRAGRGSVKYCKGPYSDQDMQWLADECEPWMFHVLGMSGKAQDVRKEFSAFKGTRLTDHHAVCAEITTNNMLGTNTRLDGAKSVCMARCGKHVIDYYWLSYEKFCELWKTKPISTWEDLQKFRPGSLVSKTGWPIPDYIKATVYCLWKGCLHQIYSRSGWGGTTYYITDVDCSGELVLRYQTTRGLTASRHIGSFTDLRHHDKMSEGQSFALSEERVRDNEMLNFYVIDKRINMYNEEWREILAAHPEWLKKRNSKGLIKPFPPPEEIYNLLTELRKSKGKQVDSMRGYKPRKKRTCKLALLAPAMEYAKKHELEEEVQQGELVGANS